MTNHPQISTMANSAATALHPYAAIYSPASSTSLHEANLTYSKISLYTVYKALVAVKKKSFLGCAGKAPGLDAKKPGKSRLSVSSHVIRVLAAPARNASLPPSRHAKYFEGF